MLFTFAYEAAGAFGARLSLRPLILGGVRHLTKLAPVGGEIIKLRLFEILKLRAGERSFYPLPQGEREYTAAVETRCKKSALGNTTRVTPAFP